MFEYQRNIWNLDKAFLCPITEICLTFGEQKKLLQKSGLPYKKKSRFEIHETVLAQLSTESSLAKRAQKLLNKKYRYYSDIVTQHSTEFLDETWKRELSEDNRDALFYVFITFEYTPPPLIDKIYQYIHILPFKEMRLKKDVLYENNQLTHELKKYKNNIKDTRNKVSVLTKKNKQLQNKLLIEKSVDKRVVIQKSCNTDELEQKLSEVKSTLNKKDLLLNRLKNDKISLRSRVKEQQELINKLTAKIATQRFLPPSKSECENCSRKDLCSRRVLMVGGIKKLESKYRSVVETMNGMFKYHEGHKSKHEELKSSVKWADTVLCPTDINSHFACLEVKKICKKLNKPYVMLQSSSINAVSQSLDEGLLVKNKKMYKRSYEND